MKLNSLRVKIIGTFFVVIILLSIILGGVIYINFRELFKEQINSKGGQISEFLNKHSSITYGFLQEDKLLLSEVIELFMKDKDVIFSAAVKPNGDIIVYKTKDEKIVDDLIWFVKRSVSKILSSDSQALKKQVLEKKTTTGEEVIIFLDPVKITREELPILGEGEKKETIKGFTVLAVSMRNFESEFTKIITNIGLLGLAITIGIMIISTILLNSNMAPLKRIRDISERISKEGDLTEKPRIETMDEIGEIAASFANMIDILKDEIEKIRNSSLRFISISRDIHKMADKMKTNFAFQGKEIGKILESVEMIYNDTSEISTTLEEVMSDIRKLETEIKRGNIEISEIEKRTENIYESLKEVLEKFQNVLKTYKDIPSALEMSQEWSSIQEKVKSIKNVIGDISESISSSETSMQNINESFYNIQQEINSIEEGISKIVQSRDKFIGDFEMMRKIMDSLNELLTELLELIDDTNLLAINAHIVASHEKGESGKEFSIIAEEIKEISKNIEENVKLIKQNVRELHQISLSQTQIVKNKFESYISEITTSKQNIENNFNKIMGSYGDIERNFKEIKTKMESFRDFSIKIEYVMKDIQENLNSIEDFTKTILNFLYSCQNELETKSNEIKEITNLISEAEKMCNIIMGNISKINENTRTVKEKVQQQYNRIDDVRKSVSELESSSNEIIKFVLMSQAKTQEILKIAKGLEELVKKFKT